MTSFRIARAIRRAGGGRTGTGEHAQEFVTCVANWCATPDAMRLAARRGRQSYVQRYTKIDDFVVFAKSSYARIVQPALAPSARSQSSELSLQYQEFSHYFNCC